jgi:hypothetical protein
MICPKNYLNLILILYRTVLPYYMKKVREMMLC